MDRLINVIDVESTCWEKQSKDQISDIIEIGISVLNPKTLEILSTESIIIKPAHSTVSKFCTELTTLTQEFVEEKGISFAEAALILKTRYNAANRLFASWGDYDRKMFQRQFEIYGVENVFGPRHLNIKALFANLFELKRGIGMDAALKLTGIPLEGTHHRGDDDSRNISKLLINMLSDEEFQDKLKAYQDVLARSYKTSDREPRE